MLQAAPLSLRIPVLRIFRLPLAGEPSKKGAGGKIEHMSTLSFYIASYFAILLVSAVAIVLLRRFMRGEPLLTDHDWLCLLGDPRERAFSPKLLFRFFLALVIVNLIGRAEAVLLLPLGKEVFALALISTIGAIILLAIFELRLVRAREFDQLTNERGPYASESH